MGAPEVLIVALFAIPALSAWAFAVRARRRRNVAHYVRALGNVADRHDPDHDEFWGRS